MGIENSLLDFVNNNSLLKPEWLENFGKNKVLTLDDLADLSGAELLDILPSGALTAEDAGNLIMEARKSWE